MTEKLKPEHRKLWRRMYLLEYEQERQTAEESEQAADKVVAQWEARGAFDDDSTPPAFVPPFAVMLSGDPGYAMQRIVNASLQFDIAVSLPRPHDGAGFGLIALTERGDRLTRKAFEAGFDSMLQSVADTR